MQASFRQFMGGTIGTRGGHSIGPRMDASPMSKTSRHFRHPLAHLSAAIVVILVHSGVALWLLQQRQPSAHDSGIRTSLRWLPPRLPPPPAARAPGTSAQTINAHVPTSPRPLQSHAQPSPGNLQTPNPAPPPLNLAIAEAAVGGTALTADTFTNQPFRRLNDDPAFQHAPRYFRLKPQMSPRQVIQGVANFLGFWPPGYEVDPCKLSRRDVNYFQNAVSARDRDALRTALLQESVRCRR